MNKLRIAAGLALLMLLGCATSAHAIPRQSLVTNSLIAYAINDTIYPQNKICVYADWTTAVAADSCVKYRVEGALPFTVESTAVYQMRPTDRLHLVLRCIPAAGDTASPVRFAIQLRGHLPYLHAVAYADTLGEMAPSDTASVFTWARWYSTTLTNVDSLTTTTAIANIMNSAVGNAQLATTPMVVGSECIVSFFPSVGAVKSATHFTWPSAVELPCVDRYGNWFYAPYFSVRIRCLSAGGAAGLKPRIILHILKQPMAVQQ